MNMFRNLLMVFLLLLGFGLMLSDPTTWHWADPAGPYVINALGFLNEMKPISFLMCFVLAVTLFMTRRQF